MRKTIAAVTTFIVVGGGAVAGAALMSPATAVAQEDDTEQTQEVSPPETLQDILDGLVADGVITQAQADAVAEALSQRVPFGFGHHHGAGHHLETVAEAIGIPIDDLTTALQDGQTIAEVAEANGVDPDDVVAALVADHDERIAQAVEDGDLTEEEAAEKTAQAAERAEALVNGEMPAKGFGFGHRGRGPGSFDAPTEEESAVSTGLVF